MVNSNPETVSTDYDTSDRLFFEPLTLEDVLNICERVQPMGVIVQFGGQTPLNLAKALEAAGVPIIGTSPESHRPGRGPRAVPPGHRNAWASRQPPNGIGHQPRRGPPDRRTDRLPRAGPAELRARRPGDGDRLRRAEPRPLHDRGRRGQPRAPDPHRQVPRGRHRGRRRRRLRRRTHHRRRRDGAHRGGRHPLRRLRLRHPAVLACPPTIVAETQARRPTRLAEALDVRGLMNIQFAVKDGEVYVLEVNPRASRTVPFVSKATGVPGPGCGPGHGRQDPGRAGRSPTEPVPTYVSVKESRLPVRQVPRRRHHPRPRDAVHRRGHGHRPRLPRRLRQEPARRLQPPPRSGTVFFSVAARDRKAAVPIASQARRAGLQPHVHRRHRRRARRARHRGRNRPQDPRRPTQPARPPGQRRHRPDRQHPQRQGRPHRRGPHPRRRRLLTASPASPPSTAPAPPPPPSNG